MPVSIMMTYELIRNRKDQTKRFEEYRETREAEET